MSLHELFFLSAFAVLGLLQVSTTRFLLTLLTASISIFILAYQMPSSWGLYEPNLRLAFLVTIAMAVILTIIYFIAFLGGFIIKRSHE
jgi:hypothetical protein